MLAGLGLAGLSFWLGWQMRDWPGDLPGPQPLRAVLITQFMTLFVIVPAAIVVWQRWRASRDRALLGLALFTALALAASQAAWAQADTAGMMQALRFTDAATALAGVVTAFRALRLA